MKKETQKTFGIKEVVFLLLLTCIVSIIMGYALASKYNIEYSKNEDSFLEEINKNYEYIRQNYYEDIDTDKLLTGAIDGMVEALGDTHSTPITNESYFTAKLTGEYNGIGVRVITDNDGKIIIYHVIENSPAEKAGVKAWDQIISIDGKTFKDSIELGDYVKQSKNKKIQITLLRDEEQLELTIERENIILQSVYSDLFENDDKKIGYIYISVFASNTAEQFKKALIELENKNMTCLIIDVRDNTGGHLTSVVDMLSSLLNSDKIIYQIQIKDKVTKYYSNGTTTKKYPIVVLQNSNSASASELLSSALKEQYGAIIIGETSYGKGTVQELVHLSNGKEYKFTTKKWLTSKGTWINEKGIKPDIEVTLSDEYKNNPSDDTDNQLQTAIQYLKEN